MKKTKLFLSLLTIAGVIMIFGDASAITFTPPAPGLIPLSAGYNYTWGINYSIESDAWIQSATLTFRGLFNSNISDSNALYIHLLDTVPVGVIRTMDTPLPGNPYALGVDTFAGQGILVVDPYWWDDPPGGIDNRSNVTFTFNDTQLSVLTAYLRDGNFGFGFSPECSFYSSDVTFDVQPIPEPGTLLLLGSGLASLGIWGRRRFGR